MPIFVDFQTIAMTHTSHEDPIRSTDPRDYQRLPRPVAAMAKRFADGSEIPPHHHERDQFVYAVRGTMRLRTTGEAWIVPPDRAVYIPGGTTHAISIRGDLEMRTLYIIPGAAPGLPDVPEVVDVSGLLRSLILALIDEPLLYDEAGRGGALVVLILDEIAGARRLALGVPMPRDPRLERICAALLADPSSRLTLERWSETAGASARTLARLFEREVGMSFGAWRRRIRLHSAIEQIVAGAPIDRVARNCGYRSASAFSAAFRAAMGISPSNLRDGDGAPPAAHSRISSQPR